MNDDRFALVDFRGDQLITIFDGRTVRVAMKPIVEALGIGWASQRQKIEADPVLSEGMTLSVIPSERGAQQTVTLPIDLLQGWLFKLNPERVAPEARERVISYQRECYQVLHDYWVKGAAINPRAGAGTGALMPVGDLIRLSEQVKAETNPALRQAFYGMLQQGFAARGIETPPLDAILPPPTGPDAQVLIERIDALLLEQPDLDKHRRDELIALRPLDLAANGIATRKDEKLALRNHSRFMGERTVNGRFGKAVHCWVFRAA